MPVLSYVTVVGSALIAALFVADAYFPAPPMIDRKPMDKSVIRLYSQQTLPPVMDLVRTAPATVTN